MSSSTTDKQTIRGYRLIRAIGRGPFATVYQALQPGFERDVAIKIILPEYANRPGFIRRFEIDCQRVARLTHPALVPLYDYWREPDGAYVIMRHLAANLDAILTNGSVTLERLIRLVQQITSALALAHRSGITHGNLKPNNILFDGEKHAQVADFGIMHLLGEPHHAALPVPTAYMAPEQLGGERPTPQTDIYSLGIILYQTLTGQQVDAATASFTLTLDNMRAVPDRSPDLAAALNRVIQRATARKPGARYPDVLELADALLNALSNHAEQGDLEPADTQTAAQDDHVDTAQRVATIALDRFIKGSAGIRWRFERQIENPYKGLQPFEESDAADFYGRTALTEQIIARLAAKEQFGRFLAVVGPSGSGKSSVVKAGIIASLRRGALPGSERWLIAEMTPKAQPLDELRTALLSIANRHDPHILEQLAQDESGLLGVIRTLFSEDDELVLVIDQFEELFTLPDDINAVKHFLNLIRVAVTRPDSRLRVIITLRADFYDRPLMYPDFCDLVSQRTEIVSPLASTELRSAIVAPLDRLGIRWDAELVSTIIDEVKDQPGTLPLLQYALTELFERREGEAITTGAYKAIGGILGALARRADEVYESLTSAQQETARQLFLRLVRLGEGTEDTRRQALHSELISLDQDTMHDVLTIFGQSRLLTFNHASTTREPTVEVAHEALIREWHRLRAWLDDSRDDLRLQRQIAAAAREWRLSGHDASFLVSGSRLDQLREWAEATDLALSQEEKGFYQASIAERDRQVQQEADRQAREKAWERQARRNLQFVAVVSTIGVIIALALAALALTQTQRARRASRDSEQSARISSEIALLSNAQLALYRYGDTDLALALALEAYTMGHLPDQEHRVLTETMYAPGTRLVFTGHEGRAYRFDLSADGTRVLSGGADATVRLWDVGAGAELQRFDSHTDEVNEVVFSPDERLAASASRDKTIRVWDVQTGDTLQVFEGEADFLAVEFHPHASIIAAGAEDHTIRLWDLESGALLSILGPDDPETEVIEGHASWVWGVTFSPDGRYLVSSDEGGRLLQWDIDTGEIFREYPFARRAYDTIISPDGKILIGATFENDVPVWDFESGEHVLTLQGHTAAVFSVALSPDGKTVLTASQDNSIRLWNLETGAELHRFLGHSDWVFDVAFLPNGTQFVSSAYDGTLRLWDIQTDQMLRQLAGHEETIYQVVFNADGTRLLSTSRDRTARLWDVETGTTIRVFGPDDPQTEVIEGHNDIVISAAFSPDGKTILTGDLSSVLILWDVETGEVLRVFETDDPDTETVEGHAVSDDPLISLSLWYVTYAPDGKTAFSAAFDKTIIHWDLESGAVLQRFAGHTDGVLGVTLFSDGQRFLSHSWDKTIVLWDVRSGEVIRRYVGHTNWIWSVALSPDEKTFISTSADNTMIMWDVATGRAIRHFLGHEDAVLSADFSPDGQLVVSSGRDKRVTLWNVQTGEWLRHFGGHANWVRSVNYSPADGIFATGDNDGMIFLWRQQGLEDMVEWAAQNRYVREPTCEERETYRITPYCSDSAAPAETNH